MEAKNGKGEMFTLDRLKQTLNEGKGLSCEEHVTFVKKRTDEFVGETLPFDDLTILCIEYKMG